MSPPPVIVRLQARERERKRGGRIPSPRVKAEEGEERAEGDKENWVEGCNGL